MRQNSDQPAAPQSLPYEQDFSSGKPGGSDGWEYYSSAEGRIAVADGKLRMDDSVNWSAYSLNEAILHLDLAGASGVVLSLDHDGTRDESPWAMPLVFTGHANRDGIAFSADGATWHRLATLPSGAATGLSFDLDAAVRAAKVGYTTDFRIKFQQHDNCSWERDGRTFDNISVQRRVETAVVPQALPYGQDFSLGKPDGAAGWEYYSNEEGRIEVVDGKLRMDDSVNWSAYSLNEATLHLNLAAAIDVVLTLDHDGPIELKSDARHAGQLIGSVA